MKIQKDDLYSHNSLTVCLLKQLSKEEKILRKKADRIRNLNIYLTNYIQEGKITDTDEINEAIDWLNHSNLSPIEIVEKVRKG